MKKNAQEQGDIALCLEYLHIDSQLIYFFLRNMIKAVRLCAVSLCSIDMMDVDSRCD